MRAWEFIVEAKTGTITRDVGLALPGAFKIPALKNQDPYLQYRFGVAIAGAKGAAQRGKDNVPVLNSIVVLFPALILEITNGEVP